MRTASLTFALLIAMTLAASAAGIWDTKPFTEWSDKDVEKVMTDSPWAGKASITHARTGANLGSVPDWPLIVTVRSASPYKEAQVRSQIGQGGAVTADQNAAIVANEPLYVIAISGIPRMYMMQAANIAKAATLKRPHKDALKPREARILLFDKDGKQVENPAPPAPAAGAPRAGGAARGGGFGGFGGFGEDKSGITATLFLGFPKDDPFAIDENEVELSTVIGAYNVIRKFKLKEMTVKGMLQF